MIYHMSQDFRGISEFRGDFTPIIVLKEHCMQMRKERAVHATAEITMQLALQVFSTHVTMIHACCGA